MLLKPLSFLLLLFPLSLAAGPSLSHCTKQSDCASPHICVLPPSNYVCPEGETTCHCILSSTGLTPCEGPNDCPNHQTCFENRRLRTRVCISASVSSAGDGRHGVEVGVGVGVGVGGSGAGAGATLDSCAGDTECRHGRKCRMLTEPVEACHGRPGCRCIGDAPVPCDADDECDSGERCVNTIALGRICVSEIVFDGDDDDDKDDDFDDDDEDDKDDEDGEDDDDDLDETDDPSGEQSDIATTTPLPTAPSTPGQGLAFEKCSTTADCLPPRECLNSVPKPDILCSHDSPQPCVCGFLILPECSDDEDCAEGEKCVPHRTKKICVAASVTPVQPVVTPEPGDVGGTVAPSTGGTDSDGATRPPTTSSPATDDVTTATTTTASGATGNPQAVTPITSPEPDDPICIHAVHLQHLPKTSLVFPSHRLARVLCDAYGSCATAGHIVRWRGRVLMMRTYCAEVGCEETVVQVNSPRYRRGLSVRSPSDGLVFTALAARFGTRFEEYLLRVVAWVGL